MNGEATAISNRMHPAGDSTGRAHGLIHLMKTLDKSGGTR